VQFFDVAIANMAPGLVAFPDQACIFGLGEFLRGVDEGRILASPREVPMSLGREGRMKNLRLLVGAGAVTAALLVIGILVHGSAAFFVWSLSALPIAILFYSVRRKNRVIYGLAEMIAAIAVLYFLFLRFGPGELTVELIAARTLAILAVVYIMVRALDNIGEGLRRGSPLETYWARLFPKTAK
jgi:hypothetical protein